MSTSLAIQSSTKNSFNEGNCNLNISQSKLVSNDSYSSEPRKAVSFEMDDSRKVEKSCKIQDAASRTIELMNDSLVPMDPDNDESMVIKKCESYEKSNKKVSIQDDETDKCSNVMRKSCEELQICQQPEKSKVGTKSKAGRKRRRKMSKASKNNYGDLKTIGTALPVKSLILTDETMSNTRFPKIGNKINSIIELTTDFQKKDITDGKYSINPSTDEIEMKQYEEETCIPHKSLEKIGIIRNLLNKIEGLAAQKFQLDSTATMPVTYQLKSENEEVESKSTLNQNDSTKGMEMGQKIDGSKTVVEGIDNLSTREFSIDGPMAENTNKPSCKYIKVEDSFRDLLINQQTVENETEKQSTKADFQMKQRKHSTKKSMVENEVDYSLCNNNIQGNMNDGKLSFEEMVVGSKKIHKAREIEFEKLEKNFANLKQAIEIRESKILVDEPTFGDEYKRSERKADEQEKLTPRPKVERSISKELNNLVNCIENTIALYNLPKPKPFTTESGAQEHLPYKETLSDSEKTSRISLVSTENLKEKPLEEIKNKRSMESIDSLKEKLENSYRRSEFENALYTPSKIPEDLSSTLIRKKPGVESTVNNDKESLGNRSFSDCFSPMILSASHEFPPPFTLKKIILTDDPNKHLSPDSQLPSISGKAFGNVKSIIKSSSTKCISDENCDFKNKSSPGKPDYIRSDSSTHDLTGGSTGDCSEDSDISDFDNRTLIILNSSFRSSNGLDSDFSSGGYKSSVESMFGAIMPSDYSSNCSTLRSKTPNFESSYRAKESLSKIQTLVDQMPNPLSVSYFMNIPFQCTNPYFLPPVNTRLGMYSYSGNFETDASIFDEISLHEKDSFESHPYFDRPQKIFDLRLSTPLSQSEFSEQERNSQANLEKHTEKSILNPTNRRFRLENNDSYLNKLNDQNLVTMEPCYNCTETAIDYPAFENNESNFNEPTSEKSNFTADHNLGNTKRDNKTNKMHGIEIVNEENLLPTPFVPLYELEYPFYVQNDNFEHLPFKPDDLMNHKPLVPAEKLIPGVHLCSTEFEYNLWRSSSDDSKIEIIAKNNLDGIDSPSVKGKKKSEKSNVSFQKPAKRFDEKQFDTNSICWNSQEDYQSQHKDIIERNNDLRFCEEHHDEEFKETLDLQKPDEVNNNQYEFRQVLIDKGVTQNDGGRNSLVNKLCQYFLMDQDNFYSLRFPSHQNKSKSNFSDTKIIEEPQSRTENLLFSEPYQESFLNPRDCLEELTDMLPKLKRKSEIKVKAENSIFKCIIITMDTDINDIHLKHFSPYSLNVVVNDSENCKTIITPSYTSLTDPRITYWKKEKQKPLPILKEMKALKLNNENVTIKRTKEVDMGSMLLNDNEKVEIRGKLLDYWKYFPKTDFDNISTQNFLHHLFKQNIPFFNYNKDVDEMVIGEVNVPTFSSIPATRPKLTVFERQSIPTVNLEIFQVLVKNTKLYFREIVYDKHSDETSLLFKLLKTGFYTPVSTVYPENPQTGKEEYNYETDTVDEKGLRSTDFKSLVQDDENEIRPNEITTVLKHARERGAMATIENISKLRVLAHRLRTIPRWKYGFARTPNRNGYCGLQVGRAFMLVSEDLS